VAILALTAVGSATGGAAIALQLDDRGGAVTASPVVAGKAGAPTSQLAKVAAAVQPSVVSIAVQGQGGGGGEGSGVILASDGTVLTNNHVIEGAANGGSITVTFADGRTGAASIVGRAAEDDLAVIRVRGVSGLTPATLGSSASMHVGDTVLAIGSPLGLEGSVTSGIVSATHRSITLGGGSQAGSSTVVQALQTDAAINPGNSGGPLVDGEGRVVGITTAIASLGSQSGQTGNIGLGFAIPIDSAKRIAEALAKGQQPQHAALGVRLALDQTGGATLTSVDSGGAANKAGLRAGDVVTGVDDVLIGDGRDLSATIRAHNPGDTVTISYTRGGSGHRVTVALGTAGG
jgi:putative serine protease PepD